MDTPVIIIYDSTVVRSQHLALIATTYINRQRTKRLFPAIGWKLAQYLEATSAWISHGPTQRSDTSSCHDDEIPTLMEAILTQIQKILPCDKKWIPNKHITTVDKRMNINIKYQQILSTGYPQYHVRSQPCMILVYSNHWVDKTCELSHIDPLEHPFPLHYNTTRILSPPLHSSDKHVLFPVPRRHRRL